MHIRLKDIPIIDGNATVAEVFDIYSKNLPQDPRLNWKLLQDRIAMEIVNEFSEPTTIEIPKSFYDSKLNWPEFLFATKHIDSNSDIELMSHHELMFMMLYERLESLFKYDQFFTELIRKDINYVKNHVLYVTSNAYNAALKESSELVIISPYNEYSKVLTYLYHDKVMGDALPILFNPSDRAIKASAMYFNVLPGSESMLAESNKIIISKNGKEFQAPGFQVFKDENGGFVGYSSLFKIGQALPARFKTHLNGNAFGVSNPSKAIFLQDVIEKDGQLVTKDNTLVDAVMVYNDIELESYRLVGGEIEVSPKVGKEIVFTPRHIETEFDEIDVKVGETIYSKGGYIKIGSRGGESIYIDMVDHIQITSIEESGYNGSARIDYVAYYKAGNARITSQTGLKGVTKTMRSCGKIKIHEDGKEDKVVDVDIVAGINSLKGKMNTIRLAQAAFAFKYGYYNNGKDYLDSLSEEEINAAVDSLPTATYEKRVKRIDGHDDEIIVIENVKYGLVQYSYTELGSHFAKVKSQGMSFNCLKYICQTKDSPLGQYILDNCIDKTDKAIVEELAKILSDEGRVFEYADNYPSYTLVELKSMFNEQDLVLSRSAIIPTSSKLLDPEFNKGFYIDLSKVRSGTSIRVPSAEILNKFCGKQNDGQYVYPTMLIELSKIIRAAITGPSQYFTIAPHRNERNQKRPSAWSGYLNAIKSMLYRTELGGQTYVKSLIQPSLKGVNLKQVHDKYVPEGKVVILDRNILESIREYIYGKPNDKTPEEAMLDQFRPLNAFTLRNPFLWRSQMIISQLWGIDEFNDYLQENYGMTVNDYLDVQGNLYCALVSTEIVKRSHSDNDGDLLQISTIPGIEQQEMMAQFELEYFTEDQKKWDEDFLLSEYSSIEDVDWSKKYELYYVPIYPKHPGDNAYMEFLCSSAMAKNAVGPGTNDAWVFYMLVQLYYGLACDNDPKSYVPWERKRKVQLRIKEEDLSTYDHIYTMVLENRVINAIKHVSGGASSHAVFYLKNMTKDDKSVKKVIESIENDLGYSREIAVSICRIVNWAVNTNALEMCNKFLRMHNKGALVDLGDADIQMWFKHIVDYTFFGGMLSPIFTIYGQSQGLIPLGENAENSMSEVMDTFDTIGF